MIVGARVRLTLHDPDEDGKTYTADGDIAAIAATPSPKITTIDGQPWYGLVAISTDDGQQFMTVNLTKDVLVLPDAAAPASDSTLALKVHALDEECAELTAENRAMQQVIAKLREENAALTLELAEAKKLGKTTKPAKAGAPQ